MANYRNWGVLKTKTRTKLLIGVMAMICLVTIYSIVDSTNVNSEEPPVREPGDPGNSPGPGLPSDIYSVEVNPIFQFTINDGFDLLL